MNPKKLILFILIIIAVTFSIISCVEKDIKDIPEDKSNIVADTTTSSEATTVPAFESNKQIMVNYLIENKNKAAGRLDGETTQSIDSAVSKTSPVTAVPNLGYKFVGWSDGITENTRTDETFTETADIYAIFEVDAYEMPVIMIDTGGTDITSKVDYIPGKISVMNTDPAYTLTDHDMEIRGRGNYTWSYVDRDYPYNKVSFKIKLSKKQNLLGQGKGPAKVWTLIANHEDQTLLRSAMAYGFAAKLDNIAYITSISNVEVYFNGEYIGVYILCEQEQINKYRIDLDDTGTEADKGYFLEMQMKESGGNYYFNVNTKTYAVISEITTQEQKDFIKKYIKDCWDAVISGDKSRVEQLMDLPSVVDTYIAEELVKNLDVGYENFYMTKPAGDVLYFASIWDMKFGGGNANQSGCDKWQDLYAGVSLGAFQEHPWFIEFMKHDWFRQMVKDRWNELPEELAWVVPFIENTAKKYHNSFERNFIRWPIFGQAINREPKPIQKLKTYDEHVAYLADWMKNRIDWLDNYINSAKFFGNQ